MTLERRHILAAAVAAALGAAAGTAAGQAQKQDPQSKQAQSKQTQSKQAQRGSTAPQAAPLIVLVPVTVASSESLGEGCWARLYDGENFRGNQLSLVGPVDMPNMRTAFGTDWSGEFDSVQVGPKATLTVYDNENYREKAAAFKANQNVPDLSDKLGLFQDIRSLKIACAGGGPTAQQGGQTGDESAGSSPASSGQSGATGK